MGPRLTDEWTPQQLVRGLQFGLESLSITLKCSQCFGFSAFFFSLSENFYKDALFCRLFSSYMFRNNFFEYCGFYSLKTCKISNRTSRKILPLPNGKFEGNLQQLEWRRFSVVDGGTIRGIRFWSFGIC